MPTFFAVLYTRSPSSTAGGTLASSRDGGPLSRVFLLSLTAALNPTLLAAYTFGCHSFRHLVGGRLDCFSCGGWAGLRHGVWKNVSSLNARHMEFAWMSLFWVAFSEVVIIVRRLIREGWIRCRWEGRPSRRP